MVSLVTREAVITANWNRPRKPFFPIDASTIATLAETRDLPASEMGPVIMMMLDFAFTMECCRILRKRRRLSADRGGYARQDFAYPHFAFRCNAQLLCQAVMYKVLY